jgi:hypothetical protein
MNLKTLTCLLLAAPPCLAVVPPLSVGTSVARKEAQTIMGAGCYYAGDTLANACSSGTAHNSCFWINEWGNVSTWTLESTNQTCQTLTDHSCPCSSGVTYPKPDGPDCVPS